MLSSRPATDEAFDAMGRFPEVITEISPRDLGFNPERPQNYDALGRHALHVVRLALLSAFKRVPDSILDLPSGHGRCLRYLVAEYPDADIAACDIDPDGVDFCARTFGVTPVYGKEHPADVELPRKYDLIWCGSLLTHLDAPMWDEFFDFFERALSPGGLLVASLQSRYWLPRKLLNPQLADWVLDSKKGQKKIITDYEQTGFGFAEYPIPPEMRAKRTEPTSYGISLVKPSWLWRFLEQRPLECVTYMEGRWGDQDVVGLIKAG